MKLKLQTNVFDPVEAVQKKQKTELEILKREFARINNENKKLKMEKAELNAENAELKRKARKTHISETDLQQ